MSIQSIGSNAASMQPMAARDAQAAKGMPERADAATSPQRAESRPDIRQAQAAEDGKRVPSADELQKALEDVAKAVAPMAQSLQFSLDKDSGKTVVKVMDTETNEVIRQIPTEEVLAISQAVDKFKGLLLKQEV